MPYAIKYNRNFSYLIHHTATRFRLQTIALDDVQLNDKKWLRQMDFEQ